MMRTTVPALWKCITARHGAAVAGSGLLVLAAGVACFRAIAGPLPIAIERPAVLIVAAVLTLVPSGHPQIQTLQRVGALYLLGIVLNEVHLQYARVAILPLDIRIAGSALPLALLAVGWLVDRRALRGMGGRDTPELLTGWLAAGGVILAHMAVLAVLLHAFYGYGYEQDIRVLGSLALYFLVFLACWRPLHRLRVRQALGVVLTVFYVAVAALRA